MNARAEAVARLGGAHRRLGAAPAGLETTRASLHQLAEQIISPARAHANGEIALRYTQRGFGTPFFAHDVPLRVSGDQLIIQTADAERSARITTLAAMVKHVVPELLPASLHDDQWEDR